MNPSNNVPKNVKAFIFDFDGVVLDSANIKTWAFPALFPAHPQHHQAILDHHLAHQGISRYKKITWVYQTLLQRTISEEELAMKAEEFSQLVFRKVLEAPFIKGAELLLKHLKATGIPAFIATGTPQLEIDRIIGERKLQPYFTEVWGSPKEKEEIISDILTRYHCLPTEVVFLGDASSDLRAAINTGVPFIAVGQDDYWLQKVIEPVTDLSTLINIHER